VRSARLEEGFEATLYAPVAQEPRENTLLVRVTSEPLSQAATLQKTISDVDPAQGVSDVRAFDDIVADAVAPSRFRASLVGLFAFVALVLATAGVYGVVTSLVVSQTTEWGIRLALGADPRRLRMGILRRHLAPILSGVALGLLASVSLARTVNSLVFGISPLDPLSLGVASTVVLTVAIIATYLPAMAATNVDPMVALRCE
jgi:putative ABC transport system permease protein